jgi:predicted enzyme related to lactoylglutathione lyase
MGGAARLTRCRICDVVSPRSTPAASNEATMLCSEERQCRALTVDLTHHRAAVETEEIEMSKNPVGWFEIYVDDMKRAQAFYEQVLLIQLVKLDSPGREMMQFPSEMKAYGSGGALIHMPGLTPGGGGTLVYFMSEDCAVEAARVKSAGGHIKREKESIGEYGFIALAVDTEGNLFGLHSMK